MSNEISTLQQSVDRGDVQEKLLEYGITHQQASERLASLSPAEIHDAAQQIDRAQAGGDPIGFVVGVLVIVLLVVLILALLGKI